MNEETFTVTVIFNNEKQRTKWLVETIAKQPPQHKETVQSLFSKPMAKNIDLNLKGYNEEENSEEQKVVQLQLPFGRPLNCS